MCYSKQNEDEAKSSTYEGGVSQTEVTLGKRPASRGDSPCTKRLKLLAVFRRFSTFLREVGKAMKSVDTKRLFNYVEHLMACDDPKIPLFTSKEFLTFLNEKCENSYAFLKRLSFHWSWIDFSLLEDIVKASRCEKAIKLLEAFKSELNQVQFLSPSTVPAPCAKMIPNKEQPHTILTLTIDCKLFECTLHYISELKSVFTQWCGISRHSLQLVAVKQISVITTTFYWMLTKELVPIICTKIQMNRDWLRSKRILEVSIYPGLVMATDGEMRLGPLAYLTISGGIVSNSALFVC